MLEVSRLRADRVEETSGDVNRFGMLLSGVAIDDREYSRGAAPFIEQVERRAPRRRQALHAVAIIDRLQLIIRDAVLDNADAPFGPDRGASRRYASHAALSRGKAASHAVPGCPLVTKTSPNRVP